MDFNSYIYDENGNIYFVDEYGNIYLVDEYGNIYDNSVIIPEIQELEEEDEKFQNIEIINPFEHSSRSPFNSWRCEYCGLFYSTKSNLQYHIKGIHEKLTYPCSYCDYQGNSKSSLYRHIKSIHEGVTYPCSYCDYQATTQSNLNKHIQSIHEE
jgi:hypothetical protein